MRSVRHALAPDIPYNTFMNLSSFLEIVFVVCYYCFEVAWCVYAQFLVNSKATQGSDQGAGCCDGGAASPSPGHEDE